MPLRAGYLRLRTPGRKWRFGGTSTCARYSPAHPWAWWCRSATRTLPHPPPPACPRAWSVQTQRRMAELLWLDASHLRPPRCRSCKCCSQMIQSPVALCAEAPCGARGTRGRREPKRSSSEVRDAVLVCAMPDAHPRGSLRSQERARWVRPSRLSQETAIDRCPRSAQRNYFQSRQRMLLTRTSAPFVRLLLLPLSCAVDEVSRRRFV
mmetsp:Transcript_42657/g.100230  ORF Transcript_42657/g.100230 Transcript_42657/m.100230 type:complete len:208 (-) Transcript_42657:499-1122(-)